MTEIEKFKLRNSQEWKDLQNSLFPLTIPKTAIWTDIDEILKVLNLFQKYYQVNHMLYPTGGGLDLINAKHSIEKGCIELNCQLIDIIKPKSLRFESFGFDYEWNYFLLETGDLKPTSIYENLEKDEISEEVIELQPGKYIDITHYESGEFQGVPFPSSMRTLSRFFSGNFLIVQKTSTYNGIPATYDGIHNKLDAAGLRKSFEIIVEKLRNE